MTNLVSFGDEAFDVEKGQTILDGALSIGIDIPFSCQVGSCRTCRCKLTSGNIRPLVDFDYVLDPDEQAQGVILTCQSTPMSDISIEMMED